MTEQRERKGKEKEEEKEKEKKGRQTNRQVDMKKRTQNYLNRK